MDDYFFTLTDLGWKYDLEESDLFKVLSKTFRHEGIKIEIVLQAYRDVPPGKERCVIEEVRCYSFDGSEYPVRDARSQFKDNEEFFKGQGFRDVDHYLEHLGAGYPMMIPFADFNTGWGCDDAEMLTGITLEEVPSAVIDRVVDDLARLGR